MSNEDYEQIKLAFGLLTAAIEDHRRRTIMAASQGETDQKALSAVVDEANSVRLENLQAIQPAMLIAERLRRFG